jgi:hypothetical protein
MGGPVDFSGLSLWPVFSAVLSGLSTGFIYGLIISMVVGIRKINSFTPRVKLAVGCLVLIFSAWAFWSVIFAAGISIATILFFLIGIALGILLRTEKEDPVKH